MKRFPIQQIIEIIPPFFALNMVAIIVYLLDLSAVAMPLILGIIAAGLVEQDASFTGKLKNMLVTLVAFTTSSLGAQFSLSDPVIFTLMITVFTFLFTLLGAFGQRYSTIAFGTLIVALYTALAHSPTVVWYLHPTLIIVGALLYMLASLVTYLIFPHHKVDVALTDVFIALSDYLDAKAQCFDPDNVDELESLQLQLTQLNTKVIVALNLCRQSLFVRLGNQTRQTKTSHLIRYYYAAQDIHEKATSSHFDYVKLNQQLRNSDLIFRLQRLLELEADACREIASAILKHQQHYPNARLQRAEKGVDDSLAYFQKYQTSIGRQQENIRTLVTNLKNILWQLLFLSKNEQGISTDKFFPENIQIFSFKDIMLRLSAHLTIESPLFRHAVRLSLVIFIGSVTLYYLNLERGYWVLLTALFVCRPNYALTQQLLKARIIGTIAGVLIGSLLPYFMATLAAKLGLLVASSTLFFLFRNKHYGLSTFFMTIQVLVSFDISGLNLYTAMLPRFFDTLLGVGIAWTAIYYLWPDWHYMKLGNVIHQCLQHNARYLLYIVAQFQFGEKNSLHYRHTRELAHQSAAELSTLITEMKHKPEKYQHYLSHGLLLLKQNYYLLGYISALGSFRQTMNQHTEKTYFLDYFYPLARQLVDLIAQLDQLTIEKVAQRVEQLQQRLLNVTSIKVFSEQQIQQDQVLRQQLTMMINLLPELHQQLMQQLAVEQTK